MLYEVITTLETGKLADITVTDQNPLSNISCLASAEHIKLRNNFV